MQFFKSLIGVKGEQVGRQMVDAIVALDPKSASAAQLRVMEQDLDKAGVLLSRLRADFEREKREAVEARENYARRLAAAEHLNRQYANASDAAQKSSLEQSLTNLVAQLETLKGEVDIEQREADEAEELVAEAEAAYREKAKALTEAKAQLERASRDMERAKIQQSRETDRANKAAEVAGLRAGQGSALTVAVDAMKRQADEARSKAEAARMKASVLTSANERNTSSMGDANIAAALAAVGNSSQPINLSDRLAALGASAPQAALPAPKA